MNEYGLPMPEDQAEVMKRYPLLTGGNSMGGRIRLGLKRHHPRPWSLYGIAKDKYMARATCLE